MKPIYTIMLLISLALAIASVVLLATYGLRLGVDFVGGSVLEVQFKNGRPPMNHITAAFAKSNDVLLREVTITPEGDQGIIVRSTDITQNAHDSITGLLSKQWPDAGMSERKFDFVGPIVGGELKAKSVRGILVVLVMVMLYIALVFRAMRRVLSPWAMGFAAMVALAHDVLIPLGVFAVLGHVLGIQISAVFVAAILTILGYSVSDTVVIFDRVRENILRGAKGAFSDVVHTSVMQTLVRSLNTTLTTLLALVAIWLFGGDSVRYFALALIIGVACGAYSSIFVAAPLLVWMNRWRSS